MHVIRSSPRFYRAAAFLLGLFFVSSISSAQFWSFSSDAVEERSEAGLVFEELIKRYATKDRSGFMQLVSRDFAGNMTALDSALSDDFRFLESIRIRPTIQRIVDYDGKCSIYFSFNRQVRSIRGGQIFQDQAVTSLTLIREVDGFKLYEMASPVIFGLSDSTSLATFVTNESVGKEVITVDRDGNVEKRQQGRAPNINNRPFSGIL